jgi:hypothetical protein
MDDPIRVPASRPIRSPAVAARETRSVFPGRHEHAGQTEWNNPTGLGVLDLKAERDQRLFGVAEQHRCLGIDEQVVLDAREARATTSL